MSKPAFWLFLARRDHPGVPAAVSTLAWLAEERGVRLEQYLEAEHDGTLFAQTGSTVLGGHHHQQFNYLHALFDVQYVVLGEVTLFRSSMSLFGGTVLAEANRVRELYEQLGLALSGDTLIVPDAAPAQGQPDFRPYLYQEVFFRKAIGIPQSEAAGLPGTALDLPAGAADYAEFTAVLARRWAARAAGVAFGDPDAILAMIATLCRERRVAVFGKRQIRPPASIIANAYAEEYSSACEVVRELTETTGNRVLVGRQTGDGDLFEWSKSGICIQIMDPNRPPFPVVATVPHRWHNRQTTVFDLEPDDATLNRWADEGRRLAALLVHSGEMAHNEAMLNLIELCAITGVKLGIGVHAARYETCPQQWETIAVSREHGGVLGLVEPVLHCGGLGVLTEATCPPARLAEHCRIAMARMGEICGPAWRPQGYLAFMDSDMPTFTQCAPAHYAAIAGAGLSYTVSAARPGRNALLWQCPGHVVLNQSTRSICTGSPYVRVTTVEDIHEKTPGTAPGWWLGVVDAPVVAFTPYIWRHGHRFMQIIEWLLHGPVINVTPHVVARYAQILQRRGLVCPSSHSVCQSR